MPAIDLDAERTYDDERFSAQEVFRTDRSKVVCGYFEPGQFIPVHAPDSDVAITVQQGTGIVREGATDHAVEPGSVVVVPAGEKRGVTPPQCMARPPTVMAGVHPWGVPATVWSAMWSFGQGFSS